MTKDKALEELFLAQKPHFDDHDAFMGNLTKRLDAVEYIHQHQEATIRRYKMAMIAAFVVGIILWPSFFPHPQTCRSLHSKCRLVSFSGWPNIPAQLPPQPSLW